MRPSASGMYQRSCTVLYPVKGTARNEHRRRRRRSRGARRAGCARLVSRRTARGHGQHQTGSDQEPPETTHRPHGATCEPPQQRSRRRYQNSSRRT
jgi:hypothetical protein